MGGIEEKENIDYVTAYDKMMTLEKYVDSMPDQFSFFDLVVVLRGGGIDLTHKEIKMFLAYLGVEHIDNVYIKCKK